MDLKSVIEVIQSKEAKAKFQELVVDQLAGKTAEEAAHLLEALESVGPVMVDVLTSTAKSLRQMPLADLVRLLGGFTGKGFVPKAAAVSPKATMVPPKVPLSPQRRRMLKVGRALACALRASRRRRRRLYEAHTRVRCQRPDGRLG